MCVFVCVCARVCACFCVFFPPFRDYVPIPGPARQPAGKRRHVCSPPDDDDDEAAAWEVALARLAEYRRTWGNADAPRKTEEGDWCAEQRRCGACRRRRALLERRDQPRRRLIRANRFHFPTRS